LEFISNNNSKNTQRKHEKDNPSTAEKDQTYVSCPWLVMTNCYIDIDNKRYLVNKGILKLNSSFNGKRKLRVFSSRSSIYKDQFLTIF